MLLRSACGRCFGIRSLGSAVLVGLAMFGTARAATIDDAPPPYVEPEFADLLTICNDALLANPTYLAARSAYDAAQEAIPLARGKLLPQLGAAAQIDRVNEDIEGNYYSVVDISISETYTRTLYGAQLKQAIYRPELFLGLSKAELQQKQAFFGMDAAQDALLMGITEAYFGVLAAQDAQIFARSQRITLQQQLDYIRSRTDAGLATISDLKAAQAAHELAVADATAADNTLTAAFITLGSLTGKTYRKLKRLPAEIALSSPQPADEGVWIERAKTQNPAVLAARAGMEVARVDRRIAQRGRYPKVDVTGLAYKLDNGGGLTGDRIEEDMRIGAALSLPLYSGGQISAAIRGATALENKAESEAEAASARAVRETRIAYLNTSAGLQRVLALKRAVEAAIEAEAAARAGFDSGTRTNADVLDAIDKRYQAEANFAAARYKFIVNSLQLKQLSGNLLTADLAQINRMLQVPSAANAAFTTP